ncbi:MAG: tetratricopeptide repeat protein [Myxococcota bacterium]|nr:tetratricopeptide repeat protein [Myxococcota bacterium]
MVVHGRGSRGGANTSRWAIAGPSKLLVAAVLAVISAPHLARASSSADELVRQARAHEASEDDDVAVRRYMEALAIEPANGDAWMGLGALRLKLEEVAEAERVYTSALDHVPWLHMVLVARARARWRLGRHEDAEADLEAYAALEKDPSVLHQLALWYSADARTPAQLATWRRLLAIAVRDGDSGAQQEARRTVQALVILVDGADPVSSPTRPDETRRALALMGRRGS